MEIRELRPGERELWLRLREALWPDASREELIWEQDEILDDPQQNTVLLAAESDEVIGFVEAALRQWAEGCSTHPVGYIEAWYVEPEWRRAGVGRYLIAAAEQWALGKGCTEMGSDAVMENDVSHAAHTAIGYTEVTRLVCYAKKLDS